MFNVRISFKLAPAQPSSIVVPSAVAELPCLVVGDAESLADDLAAYLAHDGAVVERAADIAAAQHWITRRPSGLCVVVIDTAGVHPPLNELRAAVNKQQNVDMRFVVIERGGRRQCRVVADGLVELDAETMYRHAFLEAVAIAAGRAAKPTDREVSSSDAKAILIPPSRKEARQQGHLILIAEDNEINQKVLLQQLMLLGRTADIADNGREALELWQKGGYGLLLTDLHMPEMDGYELTAAIRAAEQAAATGTPRLPIIAITANALKGEAEHCRAVGMDDYLSKPVQLVNLRAMINKWLPVVASEPTAAEILPDESTPTPPNRVTSRPVDVNVLRALIGDDEAMIREFLHDFRLSAAKIAVELHSACASAQATLAGAHAHKLKSSARSVGALTLGELCSKMEKAGKKGDTSALVKLLPKFEQELKSVESFLDSY